MSAFNCLMRCFMKSEELLMLQALKLKKLNTRGYDGPDMVEYLARQNEEEAKAKLRNICAFISPELWDQIDEYCRLLELSKRKYVEMALIDLVAKTKAVLDETKALEV